MQLLHGRLLARGLATTARRSASSYSRRPPFLRSNPSIAINRRHTRPPPPPRFHPPILEARLRAKRARLQESQSRGSQDDGTEGRKKMYILPMFPYPSGTLHMGHLRVYTVADVIARFRTLQGQDVMLPMGWDSFGLPAENAAIEHGVQPEEWTRRNISKMRRQLKRMNGSWGWDNEISTAGPAFYKHTQRIFLELWEKGLAERKEAEVNWDPVDGTVLANEQVDAEGRSWRSGARVEKRNLKQWFLRISEYREELLAGLEVLGKGNAWPERVLAMQRNWLGRSQGAMIRFPLLAYNKEVEGAEIEVFTTRPETLFGVQYLALATTHPLAVKLAQRDAELQAFLDTVPGLPRDTKVGYLLPNIRALNPLGYHGHTPEVVKESVPVYVAPYVLGDYGEGAVMGVPGHDVRDGLFWRENRYDEPVRIVVSVNEDESTTVIKNEPFVDHGVMTALSGPYQGINSKDAGRMIVDMLKEVGMAREVEKWRLRDWLISRQRYWGTPIPIVHCQSCGEVPVPKEKLPVKLPKLHGHWAEGKKGNPLERAEEWVNVPCPKCQRPAKRDTDTMDTFVDSSWYYMRFMDPKNKQLPFAAEKVKQHLPVDLYIGGIEHAILHLLYARFIYKFLMGSDLVDGGEDKLGKALREPFKRLITQGMVQGRTYTDPKTGRFLKPDEVDTTSNPSNPVIIATGETANVSFEKMSKSKYNGVDPTDVIATYGADATRAHMIFQAPVDDTLNWDESKISGVTRWLEKLHQLVVKVDKIPEVPVGEYLASQLAKSEGLSPEQLTQLDAEVALWRQVQKTIESVTASYEKVYSLNTVVSDLMILTNTIATLVHRDDNRGTKLVLKQALAALVTMAAPIVPAFAEQCWRVIHPDAGSLFESGAPVFPVRDTSSDKTLRPSKQKCAVQVNGKFKFATEIPTPPEDCGAQGLRDWVQRHVLLTKEGREKLVNGKGPGVFSAEKVIVVDRGKLINFLGVKKEE